VTLRGPKALIDAIQASDITAVVDVAEASVNDLHGGKPVVKLSAGYEAVGVMSTDNVQIMFKLVNPSDKE
jgi:hypothetical protein